MLITICIRRSETQVGPKVPCDVVTCDGESYTELAARLMDRWEGLAPRGERLDDDDDRAAMQVGLTDWLVKYREALKLAQAPVFEYSRLDPPRNKRALPVPAPPNAAAPPPSVARPPAQSAEPSSESEDDSISRILAAAHMPPSQE